MANDIDIIVRATGTGETIAELSAVRVAVDDLSGASDRNTIATTQNAESNGRLSRSLGFLTGNWKLLVPVVASAGVAFLGLTGNLAVLAPLVPVLTVALAGLIAPFTTLLAIAIAFIPPVTLMGGLLGILGAGFVIAGLKAKDGGGKLSEFAHALDVLHSMFQKTADILAHLFLPYLLQLTHAASVALQYFDRLAKMPIRQALENLSTHGVKLLTSFIDQVGAIIGKPIRLAFQIAFGPRGQTIRDAMLHVWTEIQAFFGQPPPGGGKSISEMISSWFGKQDFTAVGMRWATELSGAILSAMGAAFLKAIKTRGGAMILGGAAAGAAIGAYAGGPIGAALGLAIGAAAGTALNHYWPVITKTASNVWKTVATNAVQAWHTIVDALKQFLGPATWHNLGAIARNVWATIRTIGVTAFRVISLAARTIWHTLQEIWHIVDTLLIKTGAWKVLVGALQAAFFAVTGVVRGISAVVRAVVGVVSNLVILVAGGLSSAWSGVLGIIHSVVGAIQTAIGYATDLIGALTSAAPPGSYRGATPASGGGHGGGSSSGGTGTTKPGFRTNVRPALAGGVHIHMHTGPLDSYAARRKTAGQISRAIEQRWMRSGL